MNAWESEEVFHEGDRFFSRIENSIIAAKQTIDFECYIFENDHLGKKLLLRLSEAAQRGVKVRLLVDGIGSPHWNQSMLNDLDRQGVHASIYHPLPWVHVRALTWIKILQFLRVRPLIRSLWNLNRRNHRKVCIIDQEVAYLGGMNVSAVNLRSESGKKTWRDTSVCVRGEEISMLTEAFHNAWYDRRRRYRKNRRRKNSLKNYRNGLVKLNDSRRKRTEYRKEIIRRILECKKRIWITTPYLVPEHSFVRAIRYASWAGADVRFLLPKKNDIFFMEWVNLASYSLLLRSGVRVYEYIPSTLHAKILLLDDWITVGSTNRNQRSLIHDLEVDVVLLTSKSRQTIETRFLDDLRHSQEVTIPVWHRKSKYKILIGRLALFFRYWI